MRHDNIKDKDSNFLAGKEILIMLVVIFSALSFTLGYFVGKYGKEEKSEDLLQSSAAAPQPPEAQPLQPKTHTSAQEVFIQGTSKSSQDIKPVQSEIFVIPEKTAKTTPKQSAKESPKIDAKADAPSASDIKPQKDGQVYTVQLNALKNPEEAEKFRAKYEKKGYKTYIVVSNDKKNNKIYKIRTGEFRDKQDAEILSLKISKTEGLNTFVALKNR
jgi:cell division septation protein DedD